MRNLILTAIMVIFSFSGMVTAIAAETYKVALDGTFAPHAMPKMDGGVEGFNLGSSTIFENPAGLYRNDNLSMSIFTTNFMGEIVYNNIGNIGFILVI